ncbi:hypothetical protein GW17_00042926 [Ensete ventricosum]|nr:hypothetical protein GW17_00042926 [Ensete ventricosum]
MLFCSGGQWNSGGNCDGETEPITEDKHLAKYLKLTGILESVIGEMTTPVLYLNITRMTDYRKDAHPSVYRVPAGKRKPGEFQDCSHWCLPGVPDAWNELLYAMLLRELREVREQVMAARCMGEVVARCMGEVVARRMGVVAARRMEVEAEVTVAVAVVAESAVEEEAVVSQVAEVVVS